ncbi:hypothetical protein [Albidovulum sp.]|uniref:hypothetical protein n=1 Tax=Albidovulum sp. TaxID=1872424 RepID=UPI0039B9130E
MTDRRFRALVAATLVLFGAMAAAGSTACGQTFFPCSFDAQFLPYGPDAARRYLAAIGADLWRYLWIVQPLDLVVPALTCLSLREAFRRWAPARWTRILGGAAVLFAATDYLENAVVRVMLNRPQGDFPDAVAHAATTLTTLKWVLLVPLLMLIAILWVGRRRVGPHAGPDGGRR